MPNPVTTTERDWTRPERQEQVLASSHSWNLIPQFNEEKDVEKAERAYENLSTVVRYGKSCQTERNRIEGELDRRNEELRMLQNGQDPYAEPEKSRLDKKEYDEFVESENYDEEMWGGVLREDLGFVPWRW